LEKFAPVTTKLSSGSAVRVYSAMAGAPGPVVVKAGGENTSHPTGGSGAGCGPALAPAIGSKKAPAAHLARKLLRIRPPIRKGRRQRAPRKKDKTVAIESENIRATLAGQEQGHAAEHQLGKDE
jgi:hypothetical protein